jgi:general secretion pathway protein K
MALVITLLALVILTALVVEFSYGVYTGTINLYNWRDAQRLSLMARSGVNVSAKLLSDMLAAQAYSYPGVLDVPVQNPFEDFEGVITVRLEDENAKLNLNTLVYPNGLLNETVFDSFKRLLDVLSLEEKIADRIADWIDPDTEMRLPDSETGAKNGPLRARDEILLIHGITREDYDTLLPYITVYGDGLININGAEKPVLRSLSDDITEELAERVAEYRTYTPFEKKEEILKVAGFETTVGQSLMGRITVKGSHFLVRTTADSEGVKRIIETVLHVLPDRRTVRYWKEY